MGRRERYGSLRVGERVGYEEVVRDMKRSYRKVSAKAGLGEYKVELVTSFASIGEGERGRK